ncbi:MAG: Rieske 2Fe-2S domain-containing protein [Pseudomonadales bacterium]
MTTAVNYLRNAWYVAACSEEVDNQILATKILSERIAIYRKQDGELVALEDACPHRKLPLSMGRRVGDELQCGYHGLQFNCSGACTKAPGSKKIPTKARVHSYPIVERYGLIWLWMGDPERADEALIIDIPEWENPQWGINRGDSMALECNYLYITDNLLDPSHVAWVHQTSFGNSACEEEPLKTEMTDSGVIVSRWMKDVEVAPFYAKFVKFTGNCDRKQHYEVRYPSVAVIKALFTPAGTGGEGAPVHPDVFLMDSYNFMTPVDEGSTRYFWFQLRNFAAEDEAVSKAFAEGVRFAFNEDKEILVEVHRGMAEMQTPNIDLASDVGPLRFRHGLQQRIDAEREAR